MYFMKIDIVGFFFLNLFMVMVYNCYWIFFFIGVFMYCELFIFVLLKKNVIYIFKEFIK